jgi:ferrochelatase
MSNPTQGVLLLNLGTPDSPKVSDVRKYLREFLMDGKVINMPFLKRWMLVNLVIAPIRGPRSAKEYEKVWQEKGSPLKFHTEDLTQKIVSRLGNDYFVRFAMRYQNPSVASVLAEFKDQGINKIKIIPLYPQYADVTTESTIVEVKRVVAAMDYAVELDFVSQFYANELFTDAVVNKAKTWMEKSEYDHYLFSYHGLPERQILEASKNDCCKLDNSCCSTITEDNKFCYRAQCFETTKLVANKMELSEDQYSICFQSRLGREEWIKPYTIDAIGQLTEEGKNKVLVFSPSFVADCLETTIEVGHEYKENFLEAGGAQWDLVDSLNSDDNWVECVIDLVKN